jgi:hypothetical protein
MFKDEIEKQAYSCLRRARHFAELSEKAEIKMTPLLRKDYRQLVERCSNGEMLCVKDLQTIESVAMALRAAMNTISRGYGDRTFDGQTGGDILFDRKLELMRQTVASYRYLTEGYQVLDDMQTALQFSDFKLGRG